MKRSEAAAEVIGLATAIRNYWDTELPKRHPNYPVISPGEDSGPAPPEKKQLSDLLSNLPECDIYKLALLMHLGRGDFGAIDMAGHYEMVKKRFVNPDRAITQMLGKVPLAECLADGMAELKKSGIDVDQLTFASVHSGS